jgi:hypothetical protein
VVEATPTLEDEKYVDMIAESDEVAPALALMLYTPDGCPAGTWNIVCVPCRENTDGTSVCGRELKGMIVTV